MRSGKKALLMAACAVLLVVASVMGTLAYLTDSDDATNTFTVGNVQIFMTENGDSTEDGTAIENEYHLIPGVPQEKNPAVTVLKDSEESYVRMMVKVDGLDNLKAALNETKYYDNGDPATGVFLLQMMCNWDPNGNWKYEGFNKNTNTYEFRYAEKVAKNTDANTELGALFTTIEVPGADVNNDELALLKDVEIVVTAHAIQAASFADADAAWAAFDVQHAPATP